MFFSLVKKQESKRTTKTKFKTAFINTYSVSKNKPPIIIPKVIKKIIKNLFLYSKKSLRKYKKNIKITGSIGNKYLVKEALKRKTKEYAKNIKARAIKSNLLFFLKSEIINILVKSAGKNIISGTDKNEKLYG